MPLESATPAGRSSGILLHPTSLPGRYGIGELGANARRFVRLLADMRQQWWQMLPIGPTGYADSPYQSPSTFAGNPLLIAFDDLVEHGLLDHDALTGFPRLPSDRVDFGGVIPARTAVLDAVADGFADRAGRWMRDGYEAFCAEHGPVWLDEYALFAAIKRAHRGRAWVEWQEDLALRRPAALASARRRLAREVTRVRVGQFLFDRQFRRLRRYAAAHGIRLIGDIPIFVAHDSADVWANPDLYFLDGRGHPTVVAGVPPDYFSETGQRWGNPLYRWELHAEDGFAWWTARMRRTFGLFDLVRIDHFRGFAGYWEIPASEPTAVKGRWVEAPGTALFDHLRASFDHLPVIAEDLGVITSDVEELRDRYSFPGMKVLQFGFGAESVHALDQFRENVVAYTGTHDNDTAVGWFDDDSPEREVEHEAAKELLGNDGTEFNWALIEAVMGSVARTTVVPLQDLLGLGSEARMNTPATESGNWLWRFRMRDVTPEVVERMRWLTESTGRG